METSFSDSPTISIVNFRYREWIILTVLVLVAFVRGLPNFFVAEDFHYIHDFSISADQMWNYIFASSRVKWLGFGLQWMMTQLFGLNPVGYHLVVLIIHLIVTLLLFRVVTKLANDHRIGFLAALIFAVYPRHHQPILWYAAIHFSMMAIFALLCVYAFWNYLNTRRRSWLIATLVSLFAALLTHESAVFLFPLLVVLELTLFQPESGLKRLLQRTFYYKYVLIAAVFVVYFFISFAGPRISKLTGVQDEGAASQLVSVGGTGEAYRLSGLGLNGVKDMVSYFTYLLEPFLPLRSLELTNPISIALAGIAVLAIILLLALRNRLIFLALAWSFLAFVPTVLFVPFGNADRYIYVPAIGFAIIAAVLLIGTYDRFKMRRPIIALLGILTVGYVIVSIVLLQMRIDEWRHAGEIADSLISQTLELYPDPAPGSTFLFVDLPTTYEQAYVFIGGGMGAGVELHYGTRASNLELYQTTDQAVIDYLTNAEPVSTPLPGYHILLYQEGILQDKSAVVDNIDVLHKETWAK